MKNCKSQDTFIMDKKKILYILNSTAMGGATISFLNLVSGVSQNGYDFVVVAPKEDKKLQKQIAEIGGSYRTWGGIDSCYYRRNLINPLNLIRTLLRVFKVYIIKARSLKPLLDIVREEKPDLIHTNVGVIQEGYFVARFLKIPHVWHLREYQDKDFNLQVLPSKQTFCKMLQKSNVITITEDILKYFGLDTVNTARNIYNGILHEDEVLNILPKEKYFLCASRISSEKGHDGVIRQFAKFHSVHRDYSLVILGFGDNGYIDYLKEIIDTLECKDAIKWIGYTEQVTDYMSKAKALIVNSQFEGFGRMTAEACFNNCIVIGRDTGGTKEILEKTGGFLFSTDDGMLQCMNDVAEMSDDEYAKISNAACNTAVRLFSIEKNIEQTCDLYQSILRNN